MKPNQNSFPYGRILWTNGPWNGTEAERCPTRIVLAEAVELTEMAASSKIGPCDDKTHFKLVRSFKIPTVVSGSSKHVWNATRQCVKIIQQRWKEVKPLKLSGKALLLAVAHRWRDWWPFLSLPPSLSLRLSLLENRMERVAGSVTLNKTSSLWKQDNSVSTLTQFVERNFLCSVVCVYLSHCQSK